MTRDEIMALEAGPEMDRMIAEHVMDWTGFCCYAADEDLWGIPPGGKSDGLELNQRIPAYSDSIAAAMQVVEALRKRRILWSAAYKTGVFADDLEQPGYEVQFRRLDAEHQQRHHFAAADTLSHAISRAALLATMEMEA